MSSKKYSIATFSLLATTLRLSAAVFSVGIVSNMVNAATTALDSVSSQIDDSATDMREIYSRLPIMLDNEHYEQNRDNIKRYVESGGNVNLTFPDRVGAGAHDWSLLCTSVARNDVETINLLRSAGADVNYRNDLGVTPLHWAAYFGHSGSVNALLSPVNRLAANPMLADDHGLLPGDYLRIGFLRGIHGAYAIKSVLDSAEVTGFERKKAESGQARSYITNFVTVCESTEVSQKILKVGLVARSGDALSISNFISLLGDVMPGPSIAFTAASAAAAAVEGYQADRATDRAVDNYSVLSESDHSRLFRNLAYYLATLYGESINMLTENGAKTLGEYSAEKVDKYIEGLDSNRDQNKTFTDQIKEHFLNLSSGAHFGQLGLKKVEKQDGGKWTAKEVLNRSNGISAQREQPTRLVISPEEQDKLHLLIASEERIGQKVGGEETPQTIHPATQNENVSLQAIRAIHPDKPSSRSHIEAGDVSVRSEDGSKAAFVVGKSSEDANIKLGNVEVSAEGKSKAVGILNKSGGTSSDIETGNLSVQAEGNSQAYGFVDDASDW